MFKEWASSRNKNIYSTGRETKQSFSEMKRTDQRYSISRSSGEVKA
jgi:hypothetical protein